MSACGLTTQTADTAIDAPVSKSQITLTWPETDRAIDVSVYSPADIENAPLIVFSTGAFASPSRYERLLSPLATAGYTIASALHVDSEEHPDRKSYSQQDWSVTRHQDMQAIVQHFQSQDAKYLEWIAAGHSFGALVAQEHGGAALPGNATFADSHSRPTRIVAISPPGAISGFIPRAAFETINVPMLVITGTTDTVPNFAVNWYDHLDSHLSAPAGLSTAVIYEGQDHYFNGLYGRETHRPSVPDDDHLKRLIEIFARGEPLKSSREFPVVHLNNNGKDWLDPLVKPPVQAKTMK